MPIMPITPPLPPSHHAHHAPPPPQVNPIILSKAGLPVNKVVTSTALSSCLASALVGIFSNLPFGVSPGMGLNAFLGVRVGEGGAEMCGHCASQAKVNLRVRA